MIELFDGEQWVEVEGPLTLGNLRRARRACAERRSQGSHTLVRISTDLAEGAKALANFLPVEHYNEVKVATERELGRVEVFIISLQA